MATKHTNLEHLITEFGACETVNDMIVFVENMIDQYTAGKQEQHLRSLDEIKYKYNHAMVREAKKEAWAKRQLARMVANVCLEEKVI